MLLKASTITGCSIQATDGEIGSISDLLFEDDSWSVRWLVVDTGSWLSGRRVLLPASHLMPTGVGESAIPVDLTREQVKASPDIDVDKPVSRQLESSVYGYYGWAPYWPTAAGAYVPPVGFAGAGVGYPLTGVPPGAGAPGTRSSIETETEPKGDPHLRSLDEVTGYYIRGTDDDVGHIEDFLVDGDDWTIRYLIVDTRNWWPGKQVLIAPDWIEDIGWTDETVRVGRTRQEIKDAPEYDPTRSVERDYEDRLYRHYRVPAYWASVP